VGEGEDGILGLLIVDLGLNERALEVPRNRGAPEPPVDPRSVACDADVLEELCQGVTLPVDQPHRKGEGDDVRSFHVVEGRASGVRGTPPQFRQFIDEALRNKLVQIKSASTTDHDDVNERLTCSVLQLDRRRRDLCRQSPARGREMGQLLPELVSRLNGINNPARNGCSGPILLGECVVPPPRVLPHVPHRCQGPLICDEHL